MAKHYPFPSIAQFRDITYEIKLHSTYTGKDEKGEPIYDDSLSKPVINFKGTTKLNGTNSSVVLLKNGSMQYQSREVILDIHNDNEGFCNYMSKKEDILKEFLLLALKNKPEWFDEYIVVYGEWCGQGINKGTAIQQLEKMFVIFGCKVDDVWIDFSYELPSERIFNIQQFETFAIEVDFNDPTTSLAILNDITLTVEQECPVAKYFGVSGIGEGVVWVGSITKPTYVSPEPVTTYYHFKTKGERHKLKTKKEGITIDIDMYNSVVEFVADNLSPNRLQQGLNWMKENNHALHITSIGTFLKWCVNDVKKECKLEIEANNIDEKMLNKEASKVAREFYINYLNTHL